MANNNITRIWELLLANNFTFEGDIPENLLCMLCKKVMIEPYATLCGCQFCGKCVQKYLENERKYCPGGKKYCKESYLEMETNVVKDFITAHRIGELKAKCPNILCDVKIELENMDEHLRICEMKTTHCPYEIIGCEERMAMINMKIHFDKEFFRHSHFLVEALNNLKNELDGLKEIVEIKNKEIIKLNENFERKEMEMKQEIENQRRELNILRDTIEMREEAVKEEQYNTNMSLIEIKEMINKEIEDITRLKNVDEIREDVINQEIEKRERENKEVEEQLKKVKKDILKFDNETKKDIEKERIRIKDCIMKKDENIKREINSVLLEMRQSRINDEREFVWKVNNISKRLNGQGNYTVFMKQSYKFYFCLDCGERNLVLYCRIMKGRFDDWINWPMKHEITLSILNQETMEIYKFNKYKYDTYKYIAAFYKPIKDWDDSIGGGDIFMKKEDVENAPGLLMNDSLIVSFRIDY